MVEDKRSQYEEIKIDYQISTFKSFLYDAYTASKQATDVLFKDSRDTTTQLIAQTHLSNAISLMCAAQALYAATYDTLEAGSCDILFQKFDVFKREFLNNISTNHSHQWTDIEYREYVKALRNSGVNLPIDFSELDE